MPGFAYPHYTEQTFGEGELPQSPYLPERRNIAISDLDPVAPLDQLDPAAGPAAQSRGLAAATYAAVRPPTEASGAATNAVDGPDVLTRQEHHQPFPLEEAACRDMRETSIDNRQIFAKADRLRTGSGGFLPTLKNSADDSYPLQSPHERIWPPVPSAPADRVRPEYAKFLHQLSGKELERREAQDRVQLFKAVDL